MKLNGATVDARYIETIVIPRGDSNYVFKARPLTADDDKVFDEVCKRPVAPTFVRPGGKTESDTTDAKYITALKDYSEYKSQFLFYKSLDATDELEWDTVVESDPTTWNNVEEELLASGFLNPEIILIFNACILANGLDQTKIEKATKSFLAGQEAQVD